MSIAASSTCLAEPSTNPSTIKHLRIYMVEDSTQKGQVLIVLDESNLCETTSFKIDMSLAGGEQAYALALAAYTTNSKVRLEILNSKGCTGPWTVLQSVMIDKDF